MLTVNLPIYKAALMLKFDATYAMPIPTDLLGQAADVVNFVIAAGESMKQKAMKYSEIALNLLCRLKLNMDHLLDEVLTLDRINGLVDSVMQFFQTYASSLVAGLNVTDTAMTIVSTNVLKNELSSAE